MIKVLLSIIVSLFAYNLLASDLACIPNDYQCGFIAGDSQTGITYSVCGSCCSKNSIESGDHWAGYTLKCKSTDTDNCLPKDSICRLIPGDAGGSPFDFCKACCSQKFIQTSSCHYFGEQWSCQ